ncbi:hypothetical protein GCM10023188_42240 [Pontibacter saemangeumensis]|uniref:Uncharacterized protein n=1 Tax=Pontibacter saemangeumensis TaxID=1084525 RepID=A0ABP8M439_9BACT
MEDVPAKQAYYIIKNNHAVDYIEALEKRKKGDGVGKTPLLGQGGAGVVRFY